MSMVVMPDPVSGTGQARSGIQSSCRIPAFAGMTVLVFMAAGAITTARQRGGVTTMDKKRYEEGLAVRKAVLGAEHVEKSLRAADEFTRPLQELVTE
jgi:hypothetical protein